MYHDLFSGGEAEGHGLSPTDLEGQGLGRHADRNDSQAGFREQAKLLGEVQEGWGSVQQPTDADTLPGLA